MNAEVRPRAELSERIEKIESGYEYLLAYAAQGRSTDRDSSARSEVRARLEGFAEALDGLGPVAVRCAGGLDAEAAARPFLDALAADAAVTLSAIRLILARPDISSQLVDNFNASIHVRALLTDLFIAEETLNGGAQS